MDYLKKISEELGKPTGERMRILFSGGEDKRILSACIDLEREGILSPVILGRRKDVENTAKEIGIDFQSLDFVDIDGSPNFLDIVKSYMEIRNGQVTVEDAHKILRYSNYFGMMMLFNGYVDAFVSGSENSVIDVVKPAMRIIGTKPGIEKISGGVLMLKEEEAYLMADCFVHMNPDSETLANIAVETEDTARKLGINPKVAMLSFSTKGSAKHELVDKVTRATEMAKSINPSLELDGELQFDAAFVDSVGKKKAPGSNVAGKANVFIFPSLEAANIGYKIGENLGGFKAIGTIVQGLKKPVATVSEEADQEAIIALAKVIAKLACKDIK